MIGIIRLPSNTFPETNVTSDIVIFRKKEEFSSFKGHSFVNNYIWKNPLDEELTINEFFDDYPEFLLGEMKMVSGQFGPRQSLSPTDGDLIEKLENIVNSFPRNIASQRYYKTLNYGSMVDKGIKEFSIEIIDDYVVQNINGFWQEVNGMRDYESKNHAKAFINLRKIAVESINAQIDANLDDKTIEEKRLKLVHEFDKFVKYHGSPYNKKNRNKFGTDQEYSLLLSLQDEIETIDTVTGKTSYEYKRTGLLLGRTVEPLKEPTQADNLFDAYIISYFYRRKIDLKYISSLVLFLIGNLNLSPYLMNV